MEELCCGASAFGGVGVGVGRDGAEGVDGSEGGFESAEVDEASDAIGGDVFGGFEAGKDVIRLVHRGDGTRAPCGCKLFGAHVHE